MLPVSETDSDRKELESRLMTIKLEQVRREQARRDIARFIQYTRPDYSMEWFHAVICSHLQQFVAGSIRKLMITMPPQHGKSELSTRSLPPFLFGRNPSLKIAVLSYSATKAKKFNREIQQRITDPRYRVLFPDVRLATAKDEGVTRTTEEFDIVGHGGLLKSVGRKGSLTGDPVDVAILDDLIKDRLEAQSQLVRENAWDWITDVVETRLHNDSRMIYVTTRWDEDDPAGRFLIRDGFFGPQNDTGWVLLNFPALKTIAMNSYDHRLTGEALWPDRHSKERMENIRRNSPISFNSLYQGDPKPSQEAAIFSDWIEIEDFPECDTVFYVLDFGYTNDPTALVKVGRTGNSLYLDEILYETGLTNPMILRRAQAAGIRTSDEVIADKAEPKSIEEIRRGYHDPQEGRIQGLNITGCDKGPGSVVAGISKLKEYKVHFTRRSLNIKREVSNYQWVMAGGKATNMPIDAYNHALDAVRSGVYTKYRTSSGRARASSPGKTKAVRF